jgi:hypothetical protein
MVWPSEKRSSLKFWLAQKMQDSKWPGRDMHPRRSSREPAAVDVLTGAKASKEPVDLRDGRRLSHRPSFGELDDGQARLICLMILLTPAIIRFRSLRGRIADLQRARFR